MNETTTEPTADANANAEAPAAAAAPNASVQNVQEASAPAEAAAPAEPASSSETGDSPAPAGEAAAAGEPGAPPKKRRRRRRKSAAERAAARAAAGVTGAAGEGAAEGDDAEGDDADGEEGGEGAASAKAEGAEGDAKAADGSGGPAGRGRDARGGKGPRGNRTNAQGQGGQPGQAGQPGQPGQPGQGKRGPRDGRGPRDEKKEPRERPAFNYGDVVFGKVTEITDEVIFVDLAGKGRGVFDRREMSIPDEPAQGPDAVSVEEDDDLPPPRAAVEGTEASASEPSEPVEGAAPGLTEAAVTSATEPTANASSEASETTDAAPTSVKPREKRIIVARTIVEGETAETAANAEASETAAEAPAADTASDGESASAEGDAAASTDEATPAAAAPHAPAAAPVLPPVVLEIGSVFVGVVHNDGARGGLVVLTRHPRRASKAKPVVSTAFREKTQVEGLVTGVIKGGIEVDVDGLRAFAPRSHMDLRPGADLHHLVGQRLSFDVTQYAKKGRDVVLSRKASLEAEASTKRADALAKLPIGQVVEGTVRTVVTFGAFIDVGGVEGLVPLSEMSHNRADTPKDVFKVGEKVPVKILRIDEKGKIWLSRRSAVADPWGAVAEKYAAGSRHTGKVVRVQPFGAFIELESGIDGLIHTSDLSIKRIEHPNDVVKVGDSIDVVVSHVDTSNHKIALHPAALAGAGNPDEAPQKVVVHKMVKVVVVSPEATGLIVRVLGVTGRNARGFIPAGATGTARGTELRKVFPIGKELEAKVLEIDPKRNEVKLSIKALAEDTERSSYQQYRAQVKKEAKFGTFGDLLAKSLKKEE